MHSHRTAYLINVIVDYRLSSTHHALPFLPRICFVSKIFWRHANVHAYFRYIFLTRFQSRFCSRYESFESRKDLRARIIGTCLVFFFSFAYRPIMNRLTKKLIKIQNDQSFGILLKSLYFLSP